MTAHADRRRHPRVDDERVRALCGRVRPGHMIRVLNMSACGVLIETSRRLLPGSAVELHLECEDFRHTTRAYVVRCYVGALLPLGIVFRGAVEFEHRMDVWQSPVVPQLGISVDPDHQPK